MDKQDAEKIFRLINMMVTLLEDHKVNRKDMNLKLITDHVQRLIEVFPIIYVNQPSEKEKETLETLKIEIAEKDKQIANLESLIKILSEKPTETKIIKVPVPYEHKPDKSDILDDFIEDQKRKMKKKYPIAKWYKSWHDNNSHIYINESDSTDNIPQFTFDVNTKKASYFRNGVSYSIQ